MAMNPLLSLRLRSVLFVPAADQAKCQKLMTLEPDGVIFDLEDSVFNDHRSEALNALAGHIIALATIRKPSQRPNFVRLNAKNGVREAQRLKHLVDMGHVSALIIPKITQRGDIDAYSELKIPLILMIETPEAVFALESLLSKIDHPSVWGLILGPNDLRFRLGASSMPNRIELHYSASKLVTAAKARGLIALDGVYNHFDDDEGFVSDAKLGRGLGFDGKTLIHPRQINLANQVYMPTLDEIDWARSVMIAFEHAPEQAVVTVNGEMIELMHLTKASEILSKA
jgi:citrate lyase beta subunit